MAAQLAVWPPVNFKLLDVLVFSLFLPPPVFLLQWPNLSTERTVIAEIYGIFPDRKEELFPFLNQFLLVVFPSPSPAPPLLLSMEPSSPLATLHFTALIFPSSGHIFSSDRLTVFSSIPLLVVVVFFLCGEISFFSQNGRKTCPRGIYISSLFFNSAQPLLKIPTSYGLSIVFNSIFTLYELSWLWRRIRKKKLSI